MEHELSAKKLLSGKAELCMAQLSAMQRRSTSLWAGERVEWGREDRLRLTPVKQQCFVRPSVRPSLSGGGGDFQVELTRTES